MKQLYILFILLILLILLVPAISSAQQIEKLLQDRKSVLETTNVTDCTKASSPSLSFIRVDSAEILIQWISTTNQMGSNGYGGYTQKGEIYRYDMFKKEK